MASPAVSTASSAGSPINLAPAPPTLAIKTNNVQNMQSNHGLPTPTLMTSKEWIIPPRPKPGRKPATDTPPTKRKAQNRAAQRAFRERRAARVGELEEQLEETKEEQQKREGELKAKVAKLEADVERFNGELHSWRLRCDTLDRIAEYERREKEAALAELAYLRNGAQTTGTDAVPLPPRRLRHDHAKISTPLQQPSPAAHQDDVSMGDCEGCDPTSRCACIDKALEISTKSCGKCTLDTPCQCLEDTLNATESLDVIELKRSHSHPIREYSEKRQRHSDASTPLEVDFTAQYSTSRNLIPPQPTVHLKPPGESCGFCEEGTYCMCAEAAAMANGENENRLPPLLNEATPPPSDTDVDGNFMKLPSMQPNQMHRPVSHLFQTKQSLLTQTAYRFCSCRLLHQWSRLMSTMSSRSESRPLLSLLGRDACICNSNNTINTKRHRRLRLLWRQCFRWRVLQI